MESLEISKFFNGFNLSPVQLNATLERRQSQPRLPPAVVFHSKKSVRFQDTDAAENEVTDFLQNLNYLNFRNKVVDAEIAERQENSLDDNINLSRKLEEAKRFTSIVRKSSLLSPTVALSVISTALAVPAAASIQWPVAQKQKFKGSSTSDSNSLSEEALDYTKVLQYVPEVAFPSSSSYGSSNLHWALDNKRVYREKKRSTSLRLPSPAITAVVERCLASLDDQSMYVNSDAPQPKRTKRDSVQSCSSHIQVPAGSVSEDGATLLREKAFKDALGRHFEAVLDSLLHIVLSAVRQVKSDSGGGPNGSSAHRKRAFDDIDVELPSGVKALEWEELYTVLKAVVDQSSGPIQVRPLLFDNTSRIPYSPWVSLHILGFRLTAASAFVTRYFLESRAAHDFPLQPKEATGEHLHRQATFSVSQRQERV